MSKGPQGPSERERTSQRGRRPDEVSGSTCSFHTRLLLGAGIRSTLFKWGQITFNLRYSTSRKSGLIALLASLPPACINLKRFPARLFHCGCNSLKYSRTQGSPAGKINHALDRTIGKRCG